MRPPGSPDTLEKRRHKAISLWQKGKHTLEVANTVGATRRSVRRWKASFSKEGEKGLKAKPIPGRPLKLNREQLDGLEQALLKGAKAFGYFSDLWTCPRVAEIIFQRYGIHYHVDHIGRLLHSLGWNPQKPQRRAIERDERRVRTWIKGKWSRIKKNTTVEGSSGISR